MSYTLEGVQCTTDKFTGLLTKLIINWLPVLRQLNELFGEHAATVAQDVALKFGVSIGTQELHDDGVSSGTDANFHVLTSDW